MVSRGGGARSNPIMDSVVSIAEKLFGAFLGYHILANKGPALTDPSLKGPQLNSEYSDELIAVLYKCMALIITCKNITCLALLLLIILL
jgi:hypothetical protein